MGKKNIIITGVNGFIGSHAAKYCMEKQYHVIGTDINSTSIVNGIFYTQLNLISDDMDKLIKENEPYAIIHCAGMADVNYSMEHPDSDFVSNVMVTRKLLYSVNENAPDTKFIFMSSAGVYGNPSELPIREDFPLNPISPYALHKVIVENICGYFIRQFNLDIRILRIFSTYGAGLKKQIFWDMGQKIESTGCLKLFGRGHETRDFIHINDLAKVIMLIMESPKRDIYIYNVANGKEVEISEIARIFCAEMGYSDEIISFNQVTRAGNPTNWRADISRIQELGYRETVSLSSGIESYVTWLRSTLHIS